MPKAVSDAQARPSPHARPWRRRLAWVLLVLVVAGAWTGLVFWQTYEPQIAHVQAIVQQKTVARGGDYVPLADISPHMRDAVIAAEDSTFRTNWGVSWSGIGRAALVDVASWHFVEGASTITQQVARIAFLSRRKTLRRKAAEAALAIMMTRRIPKDRILEMYLNVVYFGQGAYGVERASQTYFAKPAATLTLAQSALLAGIIQGPSLYDPYCNLAGARQRQAYVLGQMVRMGTISAVDETAAENAPLFLIVGACQLRSGR